MVSTLIFISASCRGKPGRMFGTWRHDAHSSYKLLVSFENSRSALVDSRRANQPVSRRRRHTIMVASSDLHAEDSDDTDVGRLT